jgi:cephalosporin-C deacetylase-like acetyl esterase
MGEIMPELSENMRNLFDYDPKLPFDYEDKMIKEENGVVIHDINYTSPKSGKITAYLILPAKRKPVAGFIYGHFGYGTRTQYIPEAKLFASSGVACLLLDFPWVRPAPWRTQLGNFAKPEADYEAMIQAIIDIRRSVDLLTTLEKVKTKNIAYIGHSIGAQCGCVATALDSRIQAFVIVGGVPRTETPYLDNDDPDMVALRNYYKKENLDKYFTMMRTFDPVDCVGLISPRPILFQFARFERYFSEKAMNDYYNAAKEPKEIKWYDTGHELNDFQVVLDRAQWLEKQLNLKRLVSAVKRAVKFSL